MSGIQNRGKGSKGKNTLRKKSQTPPAPTHNPAGGSDPEEARLEASRTGCIEVVSRMPELGLTLDTFLHDLIYGNPKARNIPSLIIKKARRNLRNSPLLPTILDNLHTLPQNWKQAKGAKTPLELWANATMDDIYRKELLEHSKSTRCNIEEPVNNETFKELTFDNISDMVKANCPRLLNTLLEITKGNRHEGKQTERNSTFVRASLAVICLKLSTHDQT